MWKKIYAQIDYSTSGIYLSNETKKWILERYKKKRKKQQIRHYKPVEKEKIMTVEEILKIREINFEIQMRKRNALSKKAKLNWEKRAESSGYPKNYLCPNFNFNSVIIFKALDKVLHTRSRYGGTKAGEMKIGGYFVDCFNKKYQFIIEWMEPWHYDFNGNLERYDIEKQDYVTDVYLDYTYIIIRQSDWFENENLTEKVINKTVNHILTKINGKN